MLGFSAVADSPLTSTQIQDALDRAQAHIELLTGTKWVDGSTATPDYGQVLDEKYDGQGPYRLDYFLLKYPLPDVSAAIEGTAVVAEDTSIWVDNTQGFPSSGYLGIESDKVAYTGKTGSAFTGCTGVESAHGTAVNVKPYVIEISTTDKGYPPTFTILNENTDFDIDLSTGRVRVANYDTETSSYAGNWIPEAPNRFRASYLWGRSEITKDVERLCLLIALRDLQRTAVRKAYLTGMNSFNPELINIDDAEIEMLLSKLKSPSSANV